MTSRGGSAEHLQQVAALLGRCCQVALEVPAEKVKKQRTSRPARGPRKKLKEFEAGLAGNPAIAELDGAAGQ